MPLLSTTRWLRVTVNGAVVRTTPEVSISASLDQLCRVCAFTLAEHPASTPTDGHSVLVELIDTTEGATFALFGGIVDGGPDVESEPFDLVVTAVDQLADLRIVHTGADLDLTGMTPKEAKMAVFDYCGLTYDPDDLVDVAYALGALEPVKWLSDGSTTGAQIVQEIDRVFGLTTQTIWDNRIISFRYDYMPADATGLYRTFTKGSSIDFRAHRRERGGRDDIQTTLTVTGVTHEFNDGSCSTTPWAKAVAGTARVGRSRRVPEGTDQSDLIQDEALAAWYVADQLSRTSKIPDTGSAATVTSRHLHPGTKIAIVDPTYGIKAAPRYYCVSQVEIVGLTTDLTLVAGPPGSSGTVTSGGQQVCNDTETDVDLPGDFEPPDFGFPPLPDGDLGGIDLPGGGVDFPTPEIPDITDPPDPDAPGPDDPFTDCTETDDLVDAIGNPWRDSGDIFYRYDSGSGDTLAIGTDSTGTLFHNETAGPTPKTTANDVIYPQGETVCVSGTLIFPCDPGDSTPSNVQIILERVASDGTSINAGIGFYAAPGVEPIPGAFFGIRANPEGNVAEYSPNGVPGWCTSIETNNGGFAGTPVPFGEEVAFSVCFDVGSSPPRTSFSSDVGGGYAEDVSYLCVPFGPDPPPDACAHASGHRLKIELHGSLSSTAPDGCPYVELRNLSVGSATCVPNPDYVEPDRSGGRG